MKARGTIALAAVIGFFVMATFGNSEPNRPKEGESSTNTPSHGAVVMFGSPTYQVKGEPVEGGFMDKLQHDGKGEQAIPLTEPANTDPLKAPKHGTTSKHDLGRHEIRQ